MTRHCRLLHDVVAAGVLREGLLILQQVLFIGEGSPLVTEHLLITLVATTPGRWFLVTVSVEILAFIK